MQNIQDLPLALADFLGTSEFAGGLILFVIMFMSIELPLLMIGGKDKTKSWIPEMIGGVVSLGLGVAFGWLHYFFLLLCIFLTAVLIARLWSK